MHTPASDHCQRWDRGRHSWRHPSEGGFDRARFTVSLIPRTIAERFVARHHYIGTLGAARLCYGLLTDDDALAVDGAEVGGRALVGVAALSVPMQARVLTNVFPDLEPYAESLELGRFVLTDTPANAESFFLGHVFQQAAAGGVRGIVSFSDPMPRRRFHEDGTSETVTPGHVGLIYQATNAVACGRSTPRSLTYVPRAGTVLSDRTLQKIRTGEQGADGGERQLVALGARPRRAGESARAWLRSALDDVGAVKVAHPGNFRYAWAIGETRAARRAVRIAPPASRYPKQDRDLVRVPTYAVQAALF